ncbi:unnamed protein product, partial [Iphiclides podalirius]
MEYTITKVNVRTTNHLLDYLNASGNFVYADTWGYQYNNTWNGLSGYLVRGEVEIGGSPMFFTAERISIVEYISSPTPTRSKFVFRQPKLSYENNLFLLPFRNNVWYSVVGLMFLLFLAILVVTFWEWKKSSSGIDTGLFAFHMETGVGYKFVGKYFEEGEKCGLYEIQYLQVIDPWLAVRKNSPYVELFKIGNEEICKNSSPAANIIIVADIRCPNAKDGLLIANDCHKFKSPYRWLIIGVTPFNKPRELRTVLEHLDILTDAEVIMSQKNENNFSLYMPYKIGAKSKEWIVENFGKWESKYGFIKYKEMTVSTAIRRKDLLGEPVTVSVVITDNKTKSELLDMRTIHRDTLAKASFLHYLPIYDFINATKVIIYTDTWGYLVNGTYNGMVGHVARGEAELAGTVIFITKERLPVLEYMNYPASPSVKFVFREPSLSYQHNLFLLPFKPVVWCCILGLVFVLIIVLFINARWERVKCSYVNEFDHTVLKPNMGDIAILVISAITQQGSSTELKGTLGRVVMFILFLAFVFLYTSYSASIVALLQSSSNRIRTLSDLLNSKMELGAEDTPYNRYYFATETEPVKKAIYKYKIARRGSKSNFLKLEDGVRKLQKEPFAFNMNTGLGYRLVEQYFYEHEKCGLQEISYFPNTKPWQTCRKDSPYKEMFKIG